MNTWLMVILLLVVGYIVGRKFPQLGAPLGI
jgi:hypothetical protein